MNLNYLEAVRLLELECILPEIKREKPGRNIILEIGAGSGWQAKKLTESGYSVEAIDINISCFSKNRIWPMTDYDGYHIPFPNEYFDIVFSSNVLEHIAHVVAFQNEIKRVLKPDGISVHILPSVSWRFWTNVAHYAFIIKIVKYLIIKKLTSSTNGNNSEEAEIVAKFNQSSKTKIIRRTLIASRHGEIGNAVTELYYFSTYRWVNMFKITGWKIKKIFPNRLFYTGYWILGSTLSLKVRRLLSYILGGSCNIFVLGKGR